MRVVYFAQVVRNGVPGTLVDPNARSQGFQGPNGGPRQVSKGGLTEERCGGPRWRSDFTTSAGCGSRRSWYSSSGIRASETASSATRPADIEQLAPRKR